MSKKPSVFERIIEASNKQTEVLTRLADVLEYLIIESYDDKATTKEMLDKLLKDGLVTRSR